MFWQFHLVKCSICHVVNIPTCTADSLLVLFSEIIRFAGKMVYFLSWHIDWTDFYFDLPIYFSQENITLVTYGWTYFNHTETHFQLHTALNSAFWYKMEARGCWVEKQDRLHCRLRLSVQESLVSCSHFICTQWYSFLFYWLSVWPYYRKQLIWVRLAAISPPLTAGVKCVHLLNFCILHTLRGFEGHTDFRGLFISRTGFQGSFVRVKSWVADLEKIWYRRWCPCDGGRTPGPPGCLRSQWGSCRHSGPPPKLYHQGRSSSNGRLWRTMCLLKPQGQCTSCQRTHSSVSVWAVTHLSWACVQPACSG